MHGIVFPIGAAEQSLFRLSKRQAAAVEVQDTAGVFLLSPCIDLHIVGIDVKPRLPAGKPGAGLIAPLDRRARGITGGNLYAAQSFLDRLSEMESAVSVFGGHIQILVDGIQSNIRHAQLLALIEKGCPPLENIRGGKHGRGSPPEAQIPVAADYPGMIVVFQIEGIPGHTGSFLPAGLLALQTVFPFGKSPLELAQAESVIDILRHETVRHHRVELDQHIQDTVFSGYVGEGFFDAGKRSLADLDRAVLQCNLPEFLQILVQIRTVLIERETVDHRQKGQTVRQPGVLGNKIDDILPEAVNAQIQPEAHDALYFLPYPWVVHVQIRLLAGENMQIILSPLLIILPGKSLELTEPVVGRTKLFRFILCLPSVLLPFFLPFFFPLFPLLFPLPLIHGKSGDFFQFISFLSQNLRGFIQSLFNLHTQRVTPDIIVAVRIVPALAALNKPGMLIGGMVDDKIQKHFQA